ncbi:2-succinyl-6-hydroxy-2,4-cyclohexadiene-1-carboxylate synthase [Alicyclobacillus acidocaldarius]|uniref:Putative 2-succinyl-6-hydroxy-2,4-cyclohexadiene-1-carboxylate synthase n=1 Tax=Alicyclobacillus acidocaldarius (strain Tc-4-1) TaxID=1048834 RepID=F8IE86_ALIAT|nr:2-succinyl-6-hydroxy-2,4-cyclohexadiene-1-carboxylate synthase [Alicyclobacillus acidocaldarius]AEJ43928.1 alpha/beta hydrolase fold protein [Alicyclobacillus acidocaldarius subsp. acidocaldarius Tc-4-1]
MKRVALVRGVRYAYRLVPGGEPCLFLHGFTGAGDVFLPVLERLAGLGCRPCAILPDLLGHGASDVPDDAGRYSMDETVRDLDALLEELRIPSCQVVGYSMGGRVALAFAIAHPERVRALVLESASPGIEDASEREARRREDDALADEIEARGLEWFVSEWERRPIFATHEALPEEEKARQRAIRLSGSARGYAQSLRGLGTGRQPSYWGALGRLRMPVALVTGALDAKFTGMAKRMQSRLQNAVHVAIESAGHTPHLEQPDRFATWLAQFFSSQGRLH